MIDKPSECEEPGRSASPMVAINEQNVIQVRPMPDVECRHGHPGVDYIPDRLQTLDAFVQATFWQIGIRTGDQADLGIGERPIFIVRHWF
jgi:hypothetical protein